MHTLAPGFPTSPLGGWRVDRQPSLDEGRDHHPQPFAAKHKPKGRESHAAFQGVVKQGPGEGVHCIQGTQGCFPGAVTWKQRRKDRENMAGATAGGDTEHGGMTALWPRGRPPDTTFFTSLKLPWGPFPGTLLMSSSHTCSPFLSWHPYQLCHCCFNVLVY